MGGCVVDLCGRKMLWLIFSAPLPLLTIHSQCVGRAVTYGSADDGTKPSKISAIHLGPCDYHMTRVWQLVAQG